MQVREQGIIKKFMQGKGYGFIGRKGLPRFILSHHRIRARRGVHALHARGIRSPDGRSHGPVEGCPRRTAGRGCSLMPAGLVIGGD